MVCVIWPKIKKEFSIFSSNKRYSIYCNGITHVILIHNESDVIDLLVCSGINIELSNNFGLKVPFENNENR